MNLSRRAFLKSMGLIGLLASRQGRADWSFSNELRFVPIVQGATNATTAQFSLLRNIKEAWTYEILDSTERSLAIKSRQTFQKSYSDLCVDKILIDQLSANATYTLRVRRNSDKTVLDQRTFTTLDTSSSSLRFALVSCLSDRYPDMQMKMWRALLDKKPQVIFLIGDATYIDKVPSHYKRTFPDGSEENIWQRHIDAFLMFDIYKAQHLIPMISVWDDHDYGKNNGDSSYSLKDKSRNIYQAFLGSAPIQGYSHGPGMASLFEACGQKIFLMDDRYFRTKSWHWGPDQETWLLNAINNNPKPTWILNGNQYFGGYRSAESWEATHPGNLKTLLPQLRSAKPAIALGSGDVHFSEVMELEPALLGYRSYEFTSSALHSEAKKGADMQYRNPRRLNSTAKNNFILIESTAKANGFDLNAASIGEGGVVYFANDVSIIK